MNVDSKKVGNIIGDQKKIIGDIEKLIDQQEKTRSPDETNVIETQINSLKNQLKIEYKSLKDHMKKVFSKEISERNVKKTTNSEQITRERFESKGGKTFDIKDISPKGLEKETIKRLREKKDKKKIKKKAETSEYIKFASKMFSHHSRKLLGQSTFQKMEDQLLKANLSFTPTAYLSTIILTTILSFFAAIFIILFFSFFNFEATLPIITKATASFGERFLKLFWLMFVIPGGTFFIMYTYPSLEKKSAEYKIDSELPFATIHMAAISGSMINPINIFQIISSTKEYPALEKEFTKMINEIRVYGYDIVSAMKNTAKNTPSKKLAELLNGLATTITSGGDLPKFFNKRAETLLFSYRIKQQKSSKAAETAMDIYISVVIAAPMILMLLMMIMKISGLGIAMSVSLITITIIMGVFIVNVIFLTLLHIRKK